MYFNDFNMRFVVIAIKIYVTLFYTKTQEIG